MSIIGRIAKVAYQMTPKRKAALMKAVAASAKARAKRGAKAVGSVARNPVKAYAGSVSKRTTKSRLKSLTRTSRKLTAAKAANPKLASAVKATSIEARLTAGVRATSQTEYDRLNKDYLKSFAKVDKKGDKGVLGYLRARDARNSLRALDVQRKQLDFIKNKDVAAARSNAVSDRLLALNEKQTISLSKKYDALSKGNTAVNYTGTVARDVTTVAALSYAGNDTYKKYKDKKK